MELDKCNRVRHIEQLLMVLKVSDLMDILLISHNTAYSLVRSGQIQSFRIGRGYRITRQALMEYLLGHE